MGEESGNGSADQVSVAQQEFDSLPLKKKLLKKKVPAADVNKFLAYVQSEKNKEAGKDKKPVTGNTDDMLYTMFIKYYNLGLVIDGVNVVITGRSMAMVTFHGYKNKVRQSYPRARFDIQLVREGDNFVVGKETGRVKYTHDIGNPFDDKPIKGAYVLIRIGNDDYFEALSKRDYDEMKKASKQPFLWDKWPSEFWLKSVMKRACKRHFYDEVEEIDKLDNEMYGAVDDSMVDEKIEKALNNKKDRIEIEDSAAKTINPPKPNVPTKLY